MIDIEIDEPYVLDNHKPIHYFNEASNRHCDQKRDNYFVKQNWIVIRFSEQQVCKQAYSCCKLIADIIELTTGNSKAKKRFKDKSKLVEDPFWTLEKAIILSRKSYREQYLKDCL